MEKLHCVGDTASKHAGSGYQPKKGVLHSLHVSMEHSRGP